MDRSEHIHIGVGAVVFRGSEVLLIKRGKPPFEGCWSIPGGAVEHGESLLDAVRREVREESAVEIKILGLLDVFEALPGKADVNFQRHTLMIDYVADWRSGEPVAGDDAIEAEFVPFSEAETRLSWDLTRKALARAIEFRRRLQVRP